MPRKPTLSTAELKVLLIARFRLQRTIQAKQTAYLQRVIDPTADDFSPQDLESAQVEFQDLVTEQFSDMLARRLKRNRRTTPLLSARDIDRLALLACEHVVAGNDEDYSEAEKAGLTTFVKAGFQSFAAAIKAMTAPGQDEYAESWRWIDAVVRLAAKHQCTPKDFLAQDSAHDEITRELYTQAEFVALNQDAVKQAVTTESVRQIVLEPMLAMMMTVDPEQAQQVRAEMERDAMPELRKFTKQCRAAIRAWGKAEVKRIYGA